MDFSHALAAARAGDGKELGELLERWRALLKLQARRLLASELGAGIDPAAVVQATLNQAAAELVRFSGSQPEQWVAWLCRLLTAEVAKRTRCIYSDSGDAEQRSQSEPVHLFGGASFGLRPMTHIEEARRLAEAIDRLPEPMQTAIVHRVFLKRSWEESAPALGTTPGAARRLWVQAIEKLGEQLELEEETS